MSGLYIIPLSGLKEGRHSYNFKVENKFFELFEDSEVKEGDLLVIIEMDKRASHFDLVITITGKVKICCDRCLEMFFQPVACENRLLVKFGKSRDESDPDILILPADEQSLDIKHLIYEFVHLALPIKRVHPDDKNRNSTCDPYMLKKLEEHIVTNEKDNDPRWNELRKLMNFN